MMKNKTFCAILIFLFIIILAGSISARQINYRELNDRVRTLVQNKNYSGALNLLKPLLSENPWDVFSRSWQTYIYLTRKDSVEKAILREDINRLDSRYNFQLVLDNIRYLDTVQVEETVTKAIWQQTLNEYKKTFGNLRIYCEDMPALGYVTALARMKLVPDYPLSPLQQKRLDEINRYFLHGGKIYFDRYDADKKTFYYELSGLPLLYEFESGYSLLTGNFRDTLYFEFNDMNREAVSLSSTALDSLQYLLPPGYLVLHLDKSLQVQLPKVDKPVVHKIVGNRQSWLIPTEIADKIHLSQKQPLWKRLALWSGIGVTSIWLFSTVR